MIFVILIISSFPFSWWMKKKIIKQSKNIKYFVFWLTWTWNRVLTAVESTRWSLHEDVLIYRNSSENRLMRMKTCNLPLTCVTHFITTPSMADFRYKSTEHSAFSCNSLAVVMHFSTPTGIGKIVRPETWPCTWNTLVNVTAETNKI